jgi:hypothetical protein
MITLVAEASVPTVGPPGDSAKGSAPVTSARLSGGSEMTGNGSSEAASDGAVAELGNAVGDEETIELGLEDAVQPAIRRNVSRRGTWLRGCKSQPYLPHLDRTTNRAPVVGSRT